MNDFKQSGRYRRFDYWDIVDMRLSYVYGVLPKNIGKQYGTTTRVISEIIHGRKRKNSGGPIFRLTPVSEYKTQRQLQTELVDKAFEELKEAVRRETPEIIDKNKAKRFGIKLAKTWGFAKVKSSI